MTVKTKSTGKTNLTVHITDSSFTEAHLNFELENQIWSNCKSQNLIDTSREGGRDSTSVKLLLI